MLYPPTIDTSANDDEGSSDPSEEDDFVSVRKKQKTGFCSEFDENFRFHFDKINEDMEDDLQDVRAYFKKNVSNTLQEKIEKMRNKLSLNNIHVDNEVDDGDNGIVQEMRNVNDSVRNKKSKKRPEKSENAFFDESVSAKSMSASSCCLNFAQMNLSRPLLKAINNCGFIEPTPIQAACIPLALAGRDLCACAATGTGKTAAFMLPILERLLYKPQRKSVTRVIILVPTRELAIQVFQVSRRLAQFVQVDICLCAGGLDIKAQESALRQQPDIVIATPGRLIDHLHNSPNFSLHNVEVLVLDEADRMLDEAFSIQMKEIVRLCARNRQTLLFSATMTDQIEDLASVSLTNPVKLFIDENTKTSLKLRQEFIRIRQNRESDREAIVVALITRTFTDHTILFVKTKKDCQRLNIILGLLGVKVGQLHSGLSQSQRIETLSNFKRNVLDVLVSTDLASRGLDIEGVLTVINMNTPSSLKQYVHRVGRTARAGRVGRSITLVGEDERKVLKEIVASNQTTTLKQRLVDSSVIDAYKKRIEQLKESIEEIEEEEKAERAMRLAQQEIERSNQKLLDGKTEKRQWIKQGKPDKKKIKQEKKKLTADPKLDEEEKRLRHIANYQIRQAKRAGRDKKIHVFDERNEGEKRRQKKKKKGKLAKNFIDELTSIERKDVKRFRYGPEDEEFKAAKKERLLKKLKKRKNEFF